MHPANQYLRPDQVDEFGRELEAIRDEVLGSLGDRDRRYILRLIRLQRSTALIGRILILLSVLALPVWSHALASSAIFATLLGVGISLLALAKILENMEIGHNILHAQWDWMKDPAIQSSSWEWDHACPSDQWMHTHNVVHHTWTNVLGRDRDVGYGMLRVTAEQRWHPFYLLQPLNATLMALFFEWFIMLHDLEINRILAGKRSREETAPLWAGIRRKFVRQSTKDFLMWPLLGVVLTLPFNLAGLGPSWLTVFGIVLGANFAATILRNIWTYIIIFCGHFPAGVHHFERDSVSDETRSQWYVRQLLASCNIRGGRVFHVLSGNLSHQIEHHLFPDLPSNRYPELAPRIRALAARYGLPYNTGSLTRQFGTTVWQLLRFSLPGGGPTSAARAT